jgi:uncharacterized protein (TIGR03437 family)
MPQSAVPYYFPQLSSTSVRDAGGALYSTTYATGGFTTTPDSYQPNFVWAVCGYYNGTIPDYCAQSSVSKVSADGSKLEWSTFLGGSGANEIFDIALDSHGNVWCVGVTNSTDMPLTPGALSTEPSAGFLAALTPDGRSLFYGSYISTAHDTPVSILIDEHDSIFIAGLTNSPTFAVTPGAYRSSLTPGAVEIFAMKLNSAANKVIYSTLLGPVSTNPYGAYGCCQLTLDEMGDLFLAAGTARSDFPVTLGAYSRPGKNLDFVIAALNPTGTRVLFSTIIGGQGNEYIRGMARDSDGNLYLTGSTADQFPGEFLPPFEASVPPPSYDFPITQNALQKTFGPGFLLKLSPDASVLEYSTFLGTSSFISARYAWAVPLSINLASDGKLRMLMGSWRSDFPIKPDSYNPCFPSAQTDNDAGLHYMYARFSPNLDAIEYSTVVPNRVTPSLQPFFVDPADKLYIADYPYFSILDLSAPVPPGPTCLAESISHSLTNAAPGLLVSIFGREIGPNQPVYGSPDSSGVIPSQLSGTQVLFDGIPAPVLYTSSSRIDTVVPFGVATSGNTTVSVLKNNALSGTLTNPLKPTSLRLFYVDGQDHGSVAFNQDGTINTPQNPANKGDILTFYGTGFGAMAPPAVDGFVPVTPTSAIANPVTLTNNFCKVLYSGDAPGEVEGVVQINCQLLPTAVSGEDRFVLAEPSGQLSNPLGFTVYVR